MSQDCLLIVSHSAGFYGAEKSLLDVAKGFRSRGIFVSVVVPGSGRLVEELTDAGVRVINWKYYGWLGRRTRLIKGTFRLFFNLLSSAIFVIRHGSGFSCVYTNTITTSFGLFLSIGMRCPHVWHAREFVHEDMGAQFDLPRPLLRKLFLKNLSVVLYNSSTLQEKFLSYLGPHSSAVVYNGIRFGRKPDPFRVRDVNASTSVTLVMVGSLHEGKGHAEAVAALGYVVKQFPHAKLIIAGEGDPKYKSNIEMKAAVLGVRSHLTFLGYVEEPKNLIAAGDLFLMCSKNEAFGRVTVEAMSVGCPVVGSHSGGTREIVENGISGALYEPGNPEALAAKIIELLSNRELRLKVSHEGQRRSADFEIERSVDCILHLLTRVGALGKDATYLGGE